MATMIPRICKTCLRDFVAPLGEVNKPRRAMYCSKQCRPPWNKNMKGRQPWQNISGLLKSGNSSTQFKKGSVPYCKLHPEIMPRGEQHHDWIANRKLLKDDHRDRGGQLHREWSRFVKNRDGWKCSISNGDCSGRVEAHHILSWKDHEELRYEVSNGITLCHFHHPRKKDDEMRLAPLLQEIVNTH